MITLTVKIDERERGKLFFHLDPNRWHATSREVEFQTLVTEAFKICVEELGREPDRQVIMVHGEKRGTV